MEVTMLRKSVLILALSALLLFCACYGSHDKGSTGILSGTVTHQEDGQGVPGIRMLLVDGDYKVDTSAGADNSKAILAATVTDEEGHFDFGQISAGKYGISPASADFVFTTAQATTDGLFTLEPGEQKQVDFSATRPEANVGPAPIPISPRCDYNIDFVMTEADGTALDNPYPMLYIYRRSWILFVPTYLKVGEPWPTRIQFHGSRPRATIEFSPFGARSSTTYLVFSEEDKYRIDYVDSNQTFSYDMDLGRLSGGNPCGRFKVTMSMDPIKITVEKAGQSNVLPPPTPTGLTVTATSSSQVNLAWTAPTGTVTGYHVYKNGEYLKSVSTTSTSDTDMILHRQGWIYCYTVTAFNSEGESEKLSPQQCARRFINNGNGTVMDMQTGMMWADRDNGSPINWSDAKSYCESYRGGGYTDWRMPRWGELEKLYDARKKQDNKCDPEYKTHVATDLIHLTCGSQWASEMTRSGAAYFGFTDGFQRWEPLYQQADVAYWRRALPVRAGN
jgi:hypothetical protein